MKIRELWNQKLVCVDGKYKNPIIYQHREKSTSTATSERNEQNMRADANLKSWIFQISIFINFFFTRHHLSSSARIVGDRFPRRLRREMWEKMSYKSITIKILIDERFNWITKAFPTFFRIHLSSFSSPRMKLNCRRCIFVERNAVLSRAIDLTFLLSASLDRCREKSRLWRIRHNSSQFNCSINNSWDFQPKI